MMSKSNRTAAGTNPRDGRTSGYAEAKHVTLIRVKLQNTTKAAQIGGLKVLFHRFYAT